MLFILQSQLSSFNFCIPILTPLSPPHRVEVYDEDGNQLTLSLRVLNIEPNDFGAYTCVSSNTMGEDHKTMYLNGGNISRETA